MLSQRFAFVGAGKMATALARGFVQADLTVGRNIAAYDPSASTARSFAEACGGRSTDSNRAAVEGADVVLLAIKPQQIPAVSADLSGSVDDKLIVSVAAGVTLGTLIQGLGPKARYVRAMPNTPCLIGRGAAAYALGHGATHDDDELVGRLLGSVGRVYRLEEKLLDAVTGLSGSGPAFVYVMIEALADGGVRMGLPREVSLGLAAQTVLGSAAMVFETGLHPAVLKDQVTSPGGTTITGLQALEKGAIRSDLMGAVEAATRRAVELGKGAPPA